MEENSSTSTFEVAKDLYEKEHVICALPIPAFALHYIYFSLIIENIVAKTESKKIKRKKKNWPKVD